MPGMITLRFGNKEFFVRPLTLRQLRDIGVGLASQAGPANGGAVDAERAAYDGMIDVVKAALARDYPEEAEKILDFEVDWPTLTSAHRDILRLSGLVPSGEASAASSTGVTSTGA
jgi:hypothetical protein